MRSLFCLIGLVVNFSQAQQAGTNFLQVGSLDQCEGKDASNYTLVNTFSHDAFCNHNGGDGQEGDSPFLIACSSDGKKTVNSLQILASSRYPAGAYVQYERLCLAVSGNLAGKYVYIKQIGLQLAYLKKCSSVLGYSYTSFKSSVVLIADKLDLSVFLSPTGAYDTFKRSCTTTCKGTAFEL